jgi:capsular polysaccharide biosynthesis protein
MLEDCLKPSHINDTVAPEPSIHYIQDCRFFPHNDQFRSDIWGIYDGAGRLVLPAAFLYSRTNLGGGQRWVVDQPRNSALLPEIECAFYGGVIGLHYGHTLLEFLPRLWYLKQKAGPTTKILVHCGPGLEIAWDTPWFCDLMGLIGIRKGDLISPRQTSVVRHLFIPDPTFQINGFAHPAFTAFTNWVGDNVLHDTGLGEQPVFLTKRNLKSGVINFLNEDELCRRLEELGFRIESPEELPLGHQISLFKQKGGVSGILGSNMHTSIFARRPFGTCLNIGAHISDSFYYADKANNADFSYFFSNTIQEVESAPGFSRSFRFQEPALLADEVARRHEQLRAARRPLPQHASQEETAHVFCFPVSPDGKHLCARASDGALCTTYADISNSDSAFPIAAIMLEGRVRLFAASPLPFAIAWTEGSLLSAWLECELAWKDDARTECGLRRPDTGLLLTIVPDTRNHDAHFSANILQGWEYIAFVPPSAEQQSFLEKRYALLQHSLTSEAK